MKILIKNIEVEEKYDTMAFQIPKVDNVRVDRFAYLNRPGDSEKVQETK